MQLAFNILFFFIVPAFWLGMIRTYLIYKKRVNRERKLFDSAINAHHTEIKTFIISMILLGIVGSIFTAALGIEVSYAWIAFYELLVMLALLIPGAIFPVSILFISMIPIVFLGDNFFYLITSGNFSTILQEHNAETLDFMSLVTIVLVLQYLFLKFNRKSINSPIIEKNIRGNKFASYAFNKISVVPLILLIPGDLFNSTSAFWPIFKIYGVKVTILVVPFLIGFNLRFFNQMPENIMKRMANAIGWLAWLSLGLTVDAFVWKSSIFDVISILVIFFAYWLVLRHFKKVDRKASNPVEQSIDGIRVLGVKADTPASKMGLKIGDLIIEVNGQKVTNEDQLYKALQTKPTFCRIKIMNRNDRLEIKEEAIFADAPHEIGIVTFPSDDKL